MISLDGFVKHILSVVKLLAHGATGKPVHSTVPADLMFERLQFDGTYWSSGAMPSTREHLMP
jgi:hypothetical protein